MNESTTLANLQLVVKYIMSVMKEQAKKIAEEIPRSQFEENLEVFLNRLIEDPADKTRNEFREKTRRQLLCCIGIDLKSNDVPAFLYFNIFKNMDLSKSDVEARLLFYQTASNNHFTDAFKSISQHFKIIVCPIKDWHYYIEPTEIGLFGNDQKKFSKTEVITAIERNQNFKLKSNLLYKGSEKNYFWLCTEEDFKNFTDGNKSPDCNGLVDSLGLSHFDYEEEWIRHFFYINLGSIMLETFKPNATLINWSDPLVGFISKNGIAGETYSFTGNTTRGMQEKVFNKRTLNDNESNSAIIRMLPKAIEPPLKIDCSAIVTEGLKRFMNI